MKKENNMSDEQETKSGNSWIIFLLIVIIVVLIVGLYLAYSYRQRTVLQKMSQTFGMKKKSGFAKMGQQSQKFLSKVGNTMQDTASGVSSYLKSINSSAKSSFMPRSRKSISHSKRK